MAKLKIQLNQKTTKDKEFIDLNKANEQYNKYRELLDTINKSDTNESDDYCNWSNTLTIVPNK